MAIGLEPLTANKLDTLTVDDFDIMVLDGPYVTAVLTDGPILYWRLGESSGTTAYDYSGNGRIGTYSGSYTQGTTGLLAADPDTSLTTAGSSLGGVLSTSYIYNNSAITVECFAKIVGLPSAGTWGFIGGCNTNLLAIDKFLFFDEFGHFAFFGSTGIITSPLTYNDGKSHHVVGTYDGTTMRLYVDGVEVINGGPTGASYTGYTTPNVSVGYASVYGYNTPNAILDEFAIYSTVLSAARISAHYTAGANPSFSGSCTLYTRGYDVLNKGLNLYIRGLDTINKNLNLYTFGVSGYITKSLSLYTRGLPSPINGHINLYTSGSGIFGKNSSLNLYVNAEGIHYNSSLPLMTWGSSQSGQGLVYYDYDPINLYTRGDGTTDGFIPSNSFMNLFLKVSPGLSGNISLYERGLDQSSKGMYLYSYGVSGSLNQSLNLYTRANAGYTSGINLFARGFIT